MRTLENIIILFVVMYISIGCEKSSEIKITPVNYIYNFEEESKCKDLEESYKCEYVKKNDVSLINSNDYTLHEIKISYNVTNSSGKLNKPNHDVFIGEWRSKNDLRNKVDLNFTLFEKVELIIESKEGNYKIVYYNLDEMNKVEENCLVLSDYNVKCESGYSYIPSFVPKGFGVQHPTADDLKGIDLDVLTDTGCSISNVKCQRLLLAIF